MLRLLVSLTAALSVFSVVSADCQLTNSLTETQTEAETRPELCVTQGEGSYTFAMDNSEVDVPTLNGETPWAGISGQNAFIIYDNDCIPQGVYDPDEAGSDCGVPYTIEGSFLSYVLTIEQVDFNLGGGYFQFDYASGQYTIGNNGCVCGDLGSGLMGEQGCGCAFPVDGE
ncbi:MAG: DnaJ- protein scj1 [Chaenotheca gracillima]|nr:MAG: DnaJ- protein scj1 [Chaenotheca gracillima]